MIKKLGQKTFYDALKNNKKLVVKFQAEWCGPC